jgi:hypothetical protein
MSDFTTRVSTHPQVFAYRPLPTDPLVLAVADQLMVCQNVWPDVEPWLNAHGIQWQLLTTFLAGLTHAPKALDVDILRLKLVPPHDIVQVTRALRALPKVGPRGVSPNHILIPAALGHGCPWGPPSPSPAAALGAAVAPFQPVTVIDSGYQWDAAWGQNPLDHLGAGALTVSEAEWIAPVAGTLTGYGWVQEPPDVPDANGDGRLDALAGHANFIAGIIGQSCHHAQITVRNHNGGFAPASDDFPTEAAVARSLYKSRGAAVIDVGFAFTALDNQISCVWDIACSHLGDASIIVAPAGNQSSNLPFYPAALNFSYPGEFPNVIGVASLHRGTGGELSRSSFSNHGHWVTASAVGENVHSTFLRLDMPCEDDTAAAPANRDFTGTAWAVWNGTSFAAPKVVAAIANKLSPAAGPFGAWAAVAAQGVHDPAHDVGIKLKI